MRRVFVSVFVLMFLQLSFFASGIAQDRGVEIAYDDGTPESSVALEAFEFTSGHQRSGSEEWVGHSMLAVEFTPPAVPSRLLGARIYVAGDPETFKIRVFDTDRKIYDEGMDFGTYWLYWPYQWEVTPTSTGWVQVDLSDAEIYLWEKVYVAVEFLVDSKPSVGLDTDNPVTRSWFLKTDKIWTEYSLYAGEHGIPDGNVMIRATTVALHGYATTSATVTGASTTTTSATVTGASTTTTSATVTGASTTTTSTSKGKPVFLSALELQVATVIGLAVLVVAIIIGVRRWKRR